jgi:hypothetical protein
MNKPSDTAPGIGSNFSAEELKKNIPTYIHIPPRIETENQDTLNKLPAFLVDKGYIKDIKLWQESWGFKYDTDDKSIYISKNPMPKEEYNYLTFKIGKGRAGDSIFPRYQEMDIYRFIHEVGHAYQKFLADSESGNSNDKWVTWFTNAENGKINTTFGMLFEHCYHKRARIPDRVKGLTTYGNQPEYDSIGNKPTENAYRALEDCNELVNMYLWNQNYFKTYMDYLSARIPGYGYDSIERDSLVPISEKERQYIELLVKQYVKEMKQNISRY